MGIEFSLTPRVVPRVETKHRRIISKLPHPDSIATLEKLRQFEPQSMRGQPNSPANVLAVAEAVARLRSLNVHEMVERSADAATTAFPLIR